MDDLGSWRQALNDAFLQFQSQVAQYLPSLLGAFVLLLVGWIVARLLRGLAMRFVSATEQVIARTPGRRRIEGPKLPPASAKTLGTITFWLVMLFFVTAATQVLGLDAFAGWLSGLVQHLPTLATGAMIVAAGVLLSRLARDLVVAAAAGVAERQREMLGRAVQGIILVTAVLVGADQIGIRVTFLVILAAASAGTVVVAVALALSLGARTYVANLIGGHHLRQTYAVGQHVRIGAFQGQIVDFTPTSVVLESDEGRVTLPAKVFGEEPIVLLAAGGERGEG
jgi:hypothetical protein